MPLLQFKSANLGKSRTGLATVGYRVLDETGATVTARTTGGVFELAGGSGIYGAYVSFPDDFRGSVFWDSGQAGGSNVYAAEDYNYEANNPNVDLILSQSIDVSGTLNEISASLGTISCHVEFIKDIEGGRWIIDDATNQMIFYKNDNTTEVARFNLFDIDGNPTSTCVAERVRTGTLEC
jgi:hypothetical protein